MADLRDVFAEPGAEYRGKPFWAWNGKLEADELQRQVRVMHRMGLGGFFMHSRVGLATPYLSDEWFDMVRACVEQARELDMEAWLYDEDRWPSGAGGGLVTSDPKYRHRNLYVAVCAPEEGEFEQEPLALFSARLEGNVAEDVRRVEDPSAADLPEGHALLVFFVKADEPSSWFNDATYLDTMSHEAVQRFIEVTHEAYRREVGDHFGELVPGIFTDEPHHGGVFTSSTRVKLLGQVEGRDVVGIPWTEKLPEHFQRRYGYDILDHLPELFFKVDGREVSRPRYHYHDCKTYLFVDAFARQIYEWCEENGLKSTGHVLAESTLRSQASVGGSAMRFYEFMQAPGIDQLTEHRDEYTTAKQCASVQHQTGARWMLSELYGCTGWDWPFEGHKAVGDWQAVLGVNIRCQHLSWYTMAGQAKRDYPASISFQSPWWEHYSAVEDYYARVNALMSRGEPVRKLLVLHPVESVWARAAMGWDKDEQIDRLEKDFDNLINWLLDRHLDFDYGDEDIMGRLGSVEDGAAPMLRVGEAAYTVVLVPPVETIRSATLELLGAFRRAGGTVVFCEPLPRYVDAVESDEAAELAAECERIAFEPDTIAEAVAEARVVSVRDANGDEKPGTFYRLQEEDGDLYLFICNRDRENGTGPLSVTVQRAGNVQLWDAETGDRYAVEAEGNESSVQFTTEMPPTGSRLFVITKRDEDLPPVPEFAEVRTVDLLEDAWTAELTEPNVVVLDMPEFRIGDGAWQGPMEVLKADGAIREEIGLPLRGGSMVQPWAQKREEEGPTAEIGLRYRIRMSDAPRGPLMLALENPEYFEITLNGHIVTTDADCGWWVDPSLRLLPLDEAALVRGENVLELSGTLDRDCSLEACFLLGDFSVRVDGADVLVEPTAPAPAIGDWTEQGLPFYSGSVVFRADVQASAGGDRLFVEVPEFAGACVRVLVDGEEAGVVGWEPHEVEITDLASGKEEFQLAVEVVAHRRNAFGPLHHAEARPEWVGPAQFVTDGDLWQDEYSLVPAGLLAPPRLSVRRG
ncbi:MAG: glycosyl hydrolase [Candidatus Brocadiia bacterium]